MSEDAHNFRKLVLKLSGEDVGKCIQCGKCSAGCPLTPEMEFMPNQILELIRTNQEERVLRCNTFWYCVSCQTCSVRCPENIDIAKIMNTLRKLNLEKHIPPSPGYVVTFNKVFLDSIKDYGRVYELGLVMKYNLMTGQPLKDAGFGPAMFLKGKIALLPHRLKELPVIKTLIEKSKRFVKVPEG
jgi:heterodisulfide reductase subunit C